MPNADWRELLNAGVRAVKEQQFVLARKKLEAAHELVPNQRQVRYWLANALRMSSEPVRAENLFRGLLAEFPDDEETAFALAFLLRDQGRMEDTAAVMSRLAAQRPDRQDILLKITGFLRDSNLFDEAIQTCRTAVGLNPDEASPRYNLARLYQACGNFQAAITTLRSVVESDSSISGAWLSLAQLQKFTSDSDPDFLLLKSASGRNLGDEVNMCVAFAMGKALDDLQQWASAWDFYVKGNQLRSATQPWAADASREFVRSRLRSASGPGAPPSGITGTPVFIVGMLRSGTTLLEQRLDRHPEIGGRGELNFLPHIAARLGEPAGIATPIRAEAAQTLWKHMRLDGPEHGLYVDKNPLNFRFLDTLFSILPEAKVIHVSRDGRDSCLSCFFQLFQHPDAGFSYRLPDLVDYYRGYRQLMAHWLNRYPGMIHTVSYEQLVDSTRDALQSVLEYLGVNWEERTLETGDQGRAVRTASTWQARQPIYRVSMSRWKNYYELAPDFFDALRVIDERFDAVSD